MKPTPMQDDPNIVLPTAVRAAAARAAELHRTMQDNPEPEEGFTPEPEEGQEPPVTPEGNQTPEPPVVQQEPPREPDPAPKTADDQDSWEHKYKSLHGRFVRQQDGIRQQNDRIANLESVIASMQTTAPTTAPEPAKRLVTDEEISEYGEDFLNVVGKRTKEELAPVVAPLEAKIAELQRRLDGVQGTVAQTAQEKLLNKLDEKLPDWRKLNTDENFLEWLRLPDAFSGAIRQDMLTAAYSQGDASRVLAFFNGFLAEEAAVAPARAQPDPTVTTQPKVPLQNLAAPGRAKTAATQSGPAEKPFITRAQVAEFYANVAAGKYRGKEADKNNDEQIIFLAQQEGRIR